ncbi:MAG: acetylxylan esterase [Acidobacteria bacterium]|nr:acetylxylan esterase [Acidobacteriota bacterium]
MRRMLLTLTSAWLAVVVVAAGQQAPAGGGRAGGAAPPDPTVVGRTPEGFTLRLAKKTGHISNYNETMVPAYELPDPLVMSDGRPVRTAADWKARRAELLKLYEEDIYGRVPANAPKVQWTVTSTDTTAREGAVLRRITGTIGTAASAPTINLNVYTPAGATRPVPVILLVNFGGGPARGAGPGAGRGAAAPAGRAGQPGAAGRGNALPGEPPVAAEILARGWGYASVGYADIQPDRANSFTEGVIGTTLAPGQTRPAPGEWGTISAWAWGISRIIDYFETDQSIDARRVAVQGFSRLGKTVLWASAMDERIAAVFSGCAGEMGSSLSRRDFGETVDDMAQNYHWQFGSRFQQWVGRWNDMPVDAHMLIALSAPRPVFITGGTTDQWSDPKGEFLAQVAASPVYELLGAKGIGASELPPVDTTLATGDLAWHYHTGGHTLTVDEWKAFLTFMDRYFKN